MKYGKYYLDFSHDMYVDKENAFANAGDNFQVLATEYLYSKMGIDSSELVEIGYEETKYYNKEYVVLPATIHIINNEFTKRLPFSKYIIPSFLNVIFSINPFIEQPWLINYLKKYEPIGCRDEFTYNLLRKYDIDAFFMGCITMSFPKRDKEPDRKKTFFVDTPPELERFIPESIRESCEYISHDIPILNYPSTKEECKRIEGIARNILERYKNEATLVVTSRLHAAAPCIAMGIPVILVSKNFDTRFGWIDKFTKLYSISEADTIDWNPQPLDVEYIKEYYFKVFKKFIVDVMKEKNDIYSLSEIYENREKSNYFAGLLDILSILDERYKKEDEFVYVSWGGGVHCKYLYNLMSDRFPNSKLGAVVDKYLTGTIYNAKIIREDELEKENFDYLFITTKKGRLEALKKLRYMNKEINKDYIYFMSAPVRYEEDIKVIIKEENSEL